MSARSSVLSAVRSSVVSAVQPVLGAAPVVPYVMKRVRFDGTNDYMTRAGYTPALADGKKFAMSRWVKYFDITEKNTFNEFTSAGASGRMAGFGFGATSGRNRILFWDNTFSAPFALDCEFNPLSTGVLYNQLLSMDLSVPTAVMYLNDSTTGTTITTTTNVNVPWSTAAEAVLNEYPYSGAFRANQEDGDVWIAHNQYIDFSVEANRRKFIDGSGDPVYLGVNGELPTGTQPSIFFTGDAADRNAGTNHGANGDFTMVGAVTDV